MTTDNQDTAELADCIKGDLLDRVVMAEIQAAGDEREAREEFNAAIDKLAALSHPAPSHPATTAGGWISAGERLPEPGTECLVWVRSLYTTPGKYYATVDTWDEQREAPLSFSSATITVGLGWNDHEFDDVSHWQPITPPAITNTGGTE